MTFCPKIKMKFGFDFKKKTESKIHEFNFKFKKRTKLKSNKK